MRFRGALTTALAVAIVGAMGCYESDFPIDLAPQTAADPGVPGVWRCVPNDAAVTEPAATITVTLSGARTYAVTFQEDGKAPDRYQAYASVVGGQRIFNVRDLSGGTKPWVFMRSVLLRPSVLQLELLNGDVLGQQKSPEALRAAVKRSQASGKAFLDFCTCARAHADRE